MIVDRHRAIQKWRPVLESVFNEIKYLIPYIEDEVSYQLELKQDREYREHKEVNILTGEIIGDINKLPIYLENVRKYLLLNIPTVYLENLKTVINPMTGEILYKYNDTYLNIKSLQKQRIIDFLIEIDFNNVIDKLYDNSPEKYLRQKKLMKINAQ